MEENCVFCKIANNEMPSNKVYEDENLLAFLDINPISKGHTLVIPKKHSEDMLHVDDETLCKLTHASQKIAKAIKRAVNADGINFGINVGKAAGQIIFHTHIHIIPRFENDGYTHWKREKKLEADMEEIAESVKEKMEK